MVISTVRVGGAAAQFPVGSMDLVFLFLLTVEETRRLALRNNRSCSKGSSGTKSVSIVASHCPGLGRPLPSKTCIH